MRYAHKQEILDTVEATIGERIRKLTARVNDLARPLFSDQELELAKLKSRLDAMEEKVAHIFRRQISGVDDSPLREMVDDLARTVFNLCEERRFYYTPEERAYLCDKENRKKRAEKVSPLDIAEIREHLHEVEDSITNLSKEVRYLGDLLKRLT